MAREIKFRAWVEEENEMLPVEEMIFCEVGGVAEINDWWGDSRFILMQYTGLKDKNGVEIYEGDICRYNLDNSLHIVEFINNHWSAFCFIELATQECNHLYEFDDFEVVGNIYESPELLKGDKE